MGKIQVLSFEVANLIAAGEVVDRPASVLKELLENAIDAGAKNITAELRHGGISLIRVTDDGCGMSPADLPVALRRHATSKIREADDLVAIGTLGFRGEALAAIAAVSRVRILSKTKEAESGTILTSEGGRILDVSEVGCADGTTIVVEELFSNVPARRKFLKKDVTEAMAAAAVMEKVAMSRPDIAFTLVLDGHTRFSTTGDGKLKNTLYALLGREFAHRLLPVQGEDRAMQISGYVGAPDNVRNNRNYQNVFINGRYVKSKTVMAALEKACTSYIAPERFPVCALFLQVRLDAVDVNVHPAKLEVKFSDERAVFELVYYAVRSALANNTTRPDMSLPGGRTKGDPRAAFVPIGADTRGTQLAAPVPMAPAPAPEAPALAEREAPLSLAQTTAESEGAVPPAAAAPAAQSMPPAPEEGPAAPHRPSPAPSGLRDRWRAIQQERDTDQPGATYAPVSAPHTVLAAGIPPAPTPQATTPPPPAEQALPASLAPEASAGPDAPDATLPYRIIGEAFRCYVLVEQGEDLLWIDKHAAHERLLFEQLKAQQLADGRVSSQPLLVGIHVSLAPQELAALLEHGAELEEIGFSLQVDEAHKEVILRAVPDRIQPSDAEELLIQIAGELAAGRGDVAVTEAMRREKTLYQIACKAAIKGGRLYGEAQIAWLVSRVMALPDITVCPHGRPIAIRLKKSQLDRQFERIT